MKLNIRKAQKEDLERIAAIEEQCFPPGEAADMEKYRWRLANYPDYFIVGETEKEIAAVICMIPMAAQVITDEIFEMEKVPAGATAAVLTVMTGKNYRRQGLAEQMLTAAIDVCRSLSMKSMALTCKEHLIHYYAKFGFEKLGVSQSVHGGAVWYDMVKQLDE